MKLTPILALLVAGTAIHAATPAGMVWNELKAKRDSLSSVHQEFEISQTSKNARSSQSSKRLLVLDMAPGKWREKSMSGSGAYVRIFDGADRFYMEEGGDEYVRTKPKAKDEAAVDPTYAFTEVDVTKLVEVDRKPCGFASNNHLCITLRGPVKPSILTLSANYIRKVTEGQAAVILDMETGLLVVSQVVEVIDDGRNPYQLSISKLLKKSIHGGPTDMGLFMLPTSDMREVKELSRWSASRMKKQLTGKPAPELDVKDIHGDAITLAGLAGKTVLLDFWTTWCPPCRADAPSLEKLQQKFGGKELAIVSISVSEERELVEKYLKEHPRSFPVVLTTENEMPHPYEVSVFPTYIVINRDGTFANAVEGDEGFAELRSLLKKAGMDTD